MIIDITDAVETLEDFTECAIRFVYSRNEGGEKAQVDLVSLRLAKLIGDAPSMDVSQSFKAVNAEPVWAAGITGDQIGVAVLDTGVKRYQELEQDTQNQKNGLAHGWSARDNKNDGRKDKHGHGTLVASIISNRKQYAQNDYYGVAPDLHIIPVQVLDQYGIGSYSDVIAGIQWVIEHKAEYHIRVLNLSLSAPVQSHYSG